MFGRGCVSALQPASAATRTEHRNYRRERVVAELKAVPTMQIWRTAKRKRELCVLDLMGTNSAFDAAISKIDVNSRTSLCG